MEILMSCCWAQQQHFVSAMIHVEHPAGVGNLCKHFLHAPFIKYMLDERSDFLWFTCIWCKLPSWIWEGLFYLLWSHPKSVMLVRRILWSVRLIIFIPYVYPSTPSHWLSCSKIKESVQGELFGLPRVETSMSLMMVPHLNSVVFYCKTTMW